MKTDVRYYLERPKPGKKAAITLHFRYRNQIFRYSTGEHVLPEHWDKEKQRIKSSVLDVKLDYEDINQILDDLANEAKRIYREYRKNRKLIQLSKEIFRKRLYQFQMGEPLPDQISLGEHIAQFIERRESGTGKAYAKSSIKQYRSTQKHFKDFCKYVGIELTFEDVNLAFFEKFRDYFYSLDPPQKDNNIYKNLSTIKLMLNDAVKRELTTNDKHRLVDLAADLGVKKEVADEIALTMDELYHLYKLDLSKTDLEQVRDLFIVGAFTGLRHSDWGKVQRENIILSDDKRLIQILTEKSKKWVYIPLHPFVIEIIKKYNWELPDIESNQSINRKLKDIGKHAGFTDKVSYTKRVRGRETELSKQKYELITTHTARRSFATNGYKAGIDIRDLMAITGHSQEKTFLGYVKTSIRKDAAGRVADNAFFQQWKGG